MSICRVRLCNTSNALTFQMSGEQIRLQFLPKLFRVNSWIVQMIRQWIPDCWSGDRKCTGPKSAATNSWNWQLMTSGRSQMLATRNLGDWHCAHSSRWGTMELGAEDNDGLS